MQQHEPAWRNFQIDGAQWVCKTPPQPNPTHLLAARTHVHEDGRHDHDVSVITAEKVIVARQKARALTVSSGMLRKRGGNGTEAHFTPTCDTFQSEYLEDCQWVGDGPKRDPDETNKQTRSNIEMKQSK